MRMEVIENGRPVPKELHSAALISASDRFRERQDRKSQIRAMARRPARDEMASVRFAMRAVEQRIVRGLWVLEISQSTDGPGSAKRHGIDYMRERLDHFAAGEWQHGPSRPPVPSNREIDAAKEAQGWIEWLDEDQARLLTIAAMSKRGDRERRVNWERVKSRLPQIVDAKIRGLQDRYDRALRVIVAELTYARIAV